MMPWITSYLKYARWKFRQSRGGTVVQPRPSLDQVHFGSKSCVILDVGANVGGFAGSILLRAPLATVHMFEPNPSLSELLVRKAADFGTLFGEPRCILNGVGVGETDSTQELIVTKLSAATSFLAVAHAARHGWPQVDFAEAGRQSVPVVRIDSYLNARQIDRIKLLKLDVQGFELKALQGCGNRIRDVEYILTEVQFARLYEGAPLWHEIVSYLKTFEFIPVVMDGLCFGPDGVPLQADILFRNSSSTSAYS